MAACTWQIVLCCRFVAPLDIEILSLVKFGPDHSSMPVDGRAA
jgi:hypothetical protein